MKLEIFDKDSRERLGLINIYTYATYTDEYNAVGSFTVTVPLADETLEYLVFGNYILFDAGVLGVIKGRKSNQDDSMSIDVYGYLLNCVLTYRCFEKTVRYEGTPTEIARQMVADLFIDSFRKERNVEYIKLADDEKYIPVFDEKIKVTDTGDDLLSALEKKLSVYDLGFELYPVISNFGESSESDEIITDVSGTYIWQDVTEPGVNEYHFVKESNSDRWVLSGINDAMVYGVSRFEIMVPKSVECSFKYGMLADTPYCTFWLSLDGESIESARKDTFSNTYLTVLERGTHALLITAYFSSSGDTMKSYAYIELPAIEILPPDEKPGIIVNPDTVNLSAFEFRVIKSVDRTIDNKDGNTPVVFSFELDNLSSLEYEEDGREYATVAIVAGEGTGANRKVVEVGDKTKTGIDRIETYIDARDIQSGRENSGSGGGNGGTTPTEPIEPDKPTPPQEDEEVKQLIKFTQYGCILMNDSTAYERFYLEDVDVSKIESINFKQLVIKLKGSTSNLKTAYFNVVYQNTSGNEVTKSLYTATSITTLTSGTALVDVKETEFDISTLENVSKILYFEFLIKPSATSTTNYIRVVSGTTIDIEIKYKGV